MDKKRKRKYFIAIICLLPFITLVILELGLRIFFPQPLPGFSKGLFLKKDGLTLLHPNVSGEQQTQEFHVSIHGNSYGYRDGTWPFNKDKDAPVVWLLGDSYGFGWGVDAKDVVSTHLNNTGKLQVYNLAIPGDGFRDYHKRYQQMLSILPPPQLVVILTFDNDFSMPLLRTHLKKTGKSEYLKKIRWRLFLLKFHTVRLLRRIVNYMGANHVVASGSKDLVLCVMQESVEIHKEEYFESRSWQESFGQLQKLLQQTQEQGKVLVVRVVPPFILNDKEEAKLLKKLQVKEKQYNFRRLDIELQKLIPTYRRFTPVQKEGFFYPRDLHLTAKGHKALADFLEKEIHQALEDN